MKSKVLLIGIDGANWKVLRPMIKSNMLPNIKRLCEEGTKGVLVSTVPPLTPVAFASFHTGVNPGKHGITDFRLYEPATGNYRLVDANTLKYKSFSEIASLNNKKVISINIPLTYPPPKLNGIVIGDFLSPKVYPGFVYPREIFDNILKKINYRILGISLKQRQHVSPDEIIEDYINVEATRFNVARILMKEYDWDLFIIHNQSLDAVQHGYFHFLDKDSPHYSDYKYNIISKFFESMDKEIGNLLDIIDDNTSVILFSDHGFELKKRNVSVNAILHKAEYLKKTAKKRNILKIGKIKRFIEKVDSRGLRYKFYNLLGIDLRARRNLIFKFSSKNIDYGSSKAYMINGCYFGSVFLNSSNEETLKKDIIKAFDNLIDPVSGNKVVNHIYIADQSFDGPYKSSMPFIFLDPAEGYSFIKDSAENDIFKDIDYDRELSGGHHIEGIITVWGKNMKNFDNIRCNITDIAPTVLALLGIDVPNYMDGRILEEVFHEKPDVKIKSGEEYSEGDDKIHSLSSEDEEMVIKRLEDLGYM